MAKINANSVGIFAHPLALTQRRGAKSRPIQTQVQSGTTATFRILGRVSPEAPWIEVRAAASAGFLENLNSALPYLALEITAIAGSGSVSFWIGEA